MKKIILILLILSSFSLIHQEKWDENKDDWTPLMFAIYKKNSREFNKLIESGVDVTYQIKTSWKLDALNVAVKTNNIEAVKKLVSTKKFKNLQYYFEDSCFQSSSLIVIYFLSQGVNVNNYSQNGHSNLMSACSFATTEIVQALIRDGAEVNHQREVDGITALMLAAFNGELKKVELLLKNKADKNIRDKNGQTAYDYVEQIYPRLNIREDTKNQLRSLLR